jgi:STAS-like domain of unknown function (DUF4325)
MPISLVLPQRDSDMIYKIYEITEEYATDADSGQQLHDLIHPQLLEGNPVELDFTGVQIFASAFFNFEPEAKGLRNGKGCGHCGETRPESLFFRKNIPRSGTFHRASGSVGLALKSNEG